MNRKMTFSICVMFLMLGFGSLLLTDAGADAVDDRPSLSAPDPQQNYMANPQMQQQQVPQVPQPVPQAPIVMTAQPVPQQYVPPVVNPNPPPVQTGYVPPPVQKKGRGPFHHLANLFKSLAGVD